MRSSDLVPVPIKESATEEQSSPSTDFWSSFQTTPTAPENTSAQKPWKTKRGNFEHHGYRKNETSDELFYKFRINIKEENYEEKTRDKIFEIIQRLNIKYSTSEYLMLQGAKACLQDRTEVEESDAKKCVKFWQQKYIDKKDENEEELNKLVDQIKDYGLQRAYRDYIKRSYTLAAILENSGKAKKVYLSHLRFIGKTQFTLYPSDSIDDITIDDKYYCRLSMFLRDLDCELSKMGIQPSNKDAGDSVLGNFISFRRQLNVLGEYQQAESFAILADFHRQEQEKSSCYKFLIKTMKQPDSYRDLWDEKKPPHDNVIAILIDYSKGEANTWCNDLKLFFCGHVFFGKGRHHVTEVRGLLKKHKENSTGLAALLKELDELILSKNMNPTGSFFRRVRFINLQCQSKTDDQAVLKLE